MSSFICSDKTINRILSFLAFNNPEFKNMTSDQITKFGQKMVNLNYMAYYQRYDKKEKPYVYVWKDTVCSSVQALKSLKCFLYQCYEGNINKRKLFKKLEHIEVWLMNKVINELESYDRAEWG
jgi:hypothetical protein